MFRRWRTQDEIRATLVARRAELDGEVAELAEPVRAPGVQMQFGKRPAITRAMR